MGRDGAIETGGTLGAEVAEAINDVAASNSESRNRAMRGSDLEADERRDWGILA